MKYFFLLLVLLAGRGLPAQTTTGRVKWKSASNINYTYTGELRDGKPHGRGLAISENGGDILVFGEFKNGMIDGSTVVRHSTGRIVIADWKENKPHGMGVTVTPEKSLEYGNFVNGQFEERVIRIHADNKIVVDNVRDGKSNGRVIVINSQGNILSDIMYADGEANGQGYQYEVELKQMFEGIWEKGVWVKAAAGNYPSFMRSRSFGGNKTDDYIMIYATQTPDYYMQDTGFLYYPRTNIRQFGYFNKGYLENGIKLTGDDFRAIGRFDDKGYQGNCVVYLKDKELHAGNYISGKAEGKAVKLILDPLRITDGRFTKGKLSGNASILMENGDFVTGYYDNDRLNGEGLIVHKDGSSVKGIYKDGELAEVKELSLASGQKINLRPKDICTAINFLAKEFENNFKTINSNKRTGINDEAFRIGYTDARDCWYYFPGAKFSRILPDREGLGGIKQNEFTSGLFVSEDFAAIKKQYDDICRQLIACNLTSLQKGKVMKLVSRLRQQKIDPENGRMASLFAVPVYSGKKNTALIRVMIEKNYNATYQLTLDIISKWE